MTNVDYTSKYLKENELEVNYNEVYQNIPTPVPGKDDDEEVVTKQKTTNDVSKPSGQITIESQKNNIRATPRDVSVMLFC